MSGAERFQMFSNVSGVCVRVRSRLALHALRAYSNRRTGCVMLADTGIRQLIRLYRRYVTMLRAWRVHLPTTHVMITTSQTCTDVARQSPPPAPCR